jgi:outer membrane protein W
VLVFPLTLTAQGRANELGVFVSLPQFDSTSFEDEEEPDLGLELDFDENVGYGVSYNRYWTDHLSSEFTAQRLSGDIQVNVTGGPATITVDAGDIEMDVLSAGLQWHFGGASRFDPYIGGGVAYVSGEADVLADPEVDPEETENVDLDSETTWLANAGINFRLTDAFSLNADAKYIAYEPEDDAGDSLDINPLVFSAGVKFRF